jgi:subtilisin-like proprotein convertase family protein
MLPTMPTAVVRSSRTPALTRTPRSTPALGLGWTAALVVILLAVLPLAAARAQVFSSNTAITIPNSGIAAPYPSTINVAGFVGTPNGLRVRLKNFGHTYPEDVSVLLVAPSGQGVELLSRSGSSSVVTGLTLTFGAESTTPLPVPLVTGTFAAGGGSSAFNAPANAIPRAASLGALIAGSPNGLWRVFVQDFVGGDGGSIAGGWELEFGDFGGVAPTPSSPSTFTYQGRLEGGVTTGTIDARFSLWSHPSINIIGNRLAAPVTVSGIAVTNGLFTTPVNLGVPVPADIQTWLQVEISSPAGAPFVALTPRQPITTTPLAGAASALGRSTALPAGDVVISGPQGVLQTGSLTLRAPGALSADDSGSPGGLLRLVAGNANTAAATPPVGTSLNNDIHLIAGRNQFTDDWNGNIQFFGGASQFERMRIVGDNGFVGIGTTNPVQALDVRGSIALGTTGELRAASGEENLRMLRGTLNASGTIAVGSGFTAFRTGPGTYQVNFTTAFSGAPTVTFTPWNASLYVFISGTTNNSVTVNVRNTFNAATDAAVNFIAIGPR